MTDIAKIAAGLSEAQRTIWRNQDRDWASYLKSGKDGNPWATLCQHCYGRHAPPRDDICPAPDLQGLRSKYHLPIEMRERRVVQAVRAHLMEGR